MFGRIPTPLVRKNVNNNSVPLSPSCTPFVDKHPEFMSSSNHLTSSPTTTTRIEHIKFKRRTLIDLGLPQNSGDNCSVPLTKTFSQANVTTPYDESSQGSNSLKMKPASVNRPYNSSNNSNHNESAQGSNSWKKKPIFFNRSNNSPWNSNYDDKLPHGTLLKNLFFTMHIIRRLYQNCFRMCHCEIFLVSCSTDLHHFLCAV